MYIDSHCHLNHDSIAPLGSVKDLIHAARDHKVNGMVTICCRISEEYDFLIKTAEQYDNVWCSVGTHPHDASNDQEQKYTKDDLVDLVNSNNKIVGIGESGLDYYYDYADREDQKQSFRKHIQACIETGLPLIIHARDADQDCMDILKDEVKNVADKKLNAVLHCFSSGEDMAMEALEMGFYISFSGMITFKKMQFLRDIALKVPLDRVLIETDAPFLAPVPYRGKLNQPSYVVHTAIELAKLYNLTREEIGQQTTHNFFNLFPRAKETWVELP